MLACAGAVSMRTGTCVRSLHSTFDAAAFEPFLKRLLRHSSRGTRLVMVLGKAPPVLLTSLHRMQRAVLSLLFRLPYSPQLSQPLARAPDLEDNRGVPDRTASSLCPPHMCRLYLVRIIGTMNRPGYSGDVVPTSFGGSMTLRFGKGFKLACSRRGVFLQVPVLGQVWVGRDEVVWSRVPHARKHELAKTR